MRLSGGLKQVTMMLNEKIGPLLAHHQSRLDRHAEEILTLYEVHEMMTHVMVRAQLEGLFDDVDLSDADEVMFVHRRLAELQNEYLATQSIATWLSSIGATEPPEAPDL